MSDGDGPIDELAVAGALRRLDAVIAAHPELVGPSGPDNVSDWIDRLETDEEDRWPKTKTPRPKPRSGCRIT